ncbi:MAG: hypothetical protein ACI9GW_001989 [Halieaceae bacterium]|jgi:hypothetical protein
MDIIINDELDQFKEVTAARSALGLCEGLCEEHSGDTKCVRVYSQDNGYDWGYFAYCEEAIREDIGRNFKIIED